ncbi:MAG: hypothetical protein IT181_02875, partial [Acidobacteria bacterium]|nr:hypothetical protein [Acidobacteriota bacterium]
MDQLVRTSARALCFAVFLATAGCGGQAATPLSPVAPSPVVAAMPNFAGEWTVTYHVDECIGRYCYITHVNRDTQFTLRLIQSGDRVTGAFLSDGLVADVEGRIDAAGRLSLAGSAAAPIPDRGSLELLRFDA